MAQWTRIKELPRGEWFWRSDDGRTIEAPACGRGCDRPAEYDAPDDLCAPCWTECFTQGWPNTEQFVDQGLSPLCDAAAPRGTDPRNIYHRAYEVFRAALVDPDVPLKPNEPYFAQTTQTMLTSPTTGRTFKKPRKTILPGAKPGTIAFVDYHPTSMAPMTSLYIDYVRVRSDMRSRGIGYRMVKAFYEAFAARGVTLINWGRVMNTEAWRLLERMQAEYPSIESVGKRQF